MMLSIRCSDTDKHLMVDEAVVCGVCHKLELMALDRVRKHLQWCKDHNREPYLKGMLELLDKRAVAV